MRVLVTGATGMLGGGVAQALADRGDRVTVLQRHPSGLGLPEVLADISDTDAVRAAVSDQDAVIHLAAKVNVVGPEAEYRRVNVQGTRAVVDSCVTAGVPRLVHVSSPPSHTPAPLIGPGAIPPRRRAAGPYAKQSRRGADRAGAGEARCGACATLGFGAKAHAAGGPMVDLPQKATAPDRVGCSSDHSTYVVSAVEALLAALDRCTKHATAWRVGPTAAAPSGVLAAYAARPGVPEPTRHVPVGLARAGGFIVESPGRWPRLCVRRSADDRRDPFLVEQLSTAHWFDQRLTRQVLQWEPRVSLDEGFAELQRWYTHGGSAPVDPR